MVGVNYCYPSVMLVDMNQAHNASINMIFVSATKNSHSRREQRDRQGVRKGLKIISVN